MFRQLLSSLRNRGIKSSADLNQFLLSSKTAKIKENILAKKTGNAYKQLNKLIKEHPNNAELYQLKGSAQQLDNNPAAQQNLQQAVKLDNTQPLWVKRQAGLPVYSMVKLDPWGIAYFPMPKCASSSIKSLLIKIETDQDLIFAHPYYENPAKQTQPYDAPDLSDYYSFAIIREPIERFLSYYQKNVNEEKSLQKEALQLGYKTHLDLQPSLERFIDDLESYIFAFEDVRHHTLPQSAYLKNVLDHMDDLFQIKDLPKLHKKLNKKMGRKLLLSHLMESKNKPPKANIDLKKTQLEKLKKFYAEDYKLLFKKSGN